MEDGAPENRRGRLLVASPALQDPNFQRAVVLMLEHSTEGALGLVLNHPTTLLARDALPGPLAEAMSLGEHIHRGGPVQPEAVIVLAEFDRPEMAASIAFADVGVVDPDAESDGLDAGVRSLRAFGGYAGWSGGQLEQEIAEEAWIDAEPESADVFTAEAEGLWARVLERKGGAWRIIARMPDDPSQN